MTAGAGPRPTDRGGTGPGRTIALGAAVLALGALARGGWTAGLAAAAGGVALLVLLERVRGGRWRTAAAIAGLTVLGLEAVAAAPTAASELVAGLGGLALLAWVAPARPGGIGRILEGLLLPGLAVGIAYATGAFLPPIAGLATVGVALVIGILLAIALVLGQPGLLRARAEAS